jgi:hypothetical protein
MVQGTLSFDAITACELNWVTGSAARPAQELSTAALS